MNDANAMTLLFAIFTAVGVLFIGLGWPLLQGRVPPNHWLCLITPNRLSGFGSEG